MSKKPMFSIVIIGFNTAKNLKKLLGSIENIIWNNDAIEVIYIDDGSSDNSLFIFENYNLKFQKKHFVFPKNRGRVYARNKGIELSTGDWILFLNSNVWVEKNIIAKFDQAPKKNVIAIGGLIKYETANVKYQHYLNHSLRGINKYAQYEIIHYKHLLFGNCLIKRSVCQKILFNLKLCHYGGEELDFSYRLQKKYPQKIIACKDAVVTRTQHPNLLDHCKRLEEFGKYNLKKMGLKLKLTVIKNHFFLKQNVFSKYIILYINKLAILCYRGGLLSHKNIQLIMFTSILKGFYNITQPHNRHSQDLQ